MVRIGYVYSQQNYSVDKKRHKTDLSKIQHIMVSACIEAIQQKQTKKKHKLMFS